MELVAGGGEGVALVDRELELLLGRPYMGGVVGGALVVRVAAGVVEQPRGVAEQVSGKSWAVLSQTGQTDYVMRYGFMGSQYGVQPNELGVEEKEIRVFTTRPDTVYGVTFFVVAPEISIGVLRTRRLKSFSRVSIDFTGWPTNDGVR